MTAIAAALSRAENNKLIYSAEVYNLCVEAIRSEHPNWVVTKIASALREKRMCLNVVVQHYLDTVVYPDLKGPTEMPGGGHGGLADKGRSFDAPAPALNTDDEATISLPWTGQAFRASSSVVGEVGGAAEDMPETGPGSDASPVSTHHIAPSAPHVRDGEGLTSCARDGHRSAVLPVVIHKPISESFVAAAKAGAKAVAVSVLDTFKVRDGRAIGDVTFGELERLFNANAMEASLIRQITRHVANPQPYDRVRDLIKASDLQLMIQRAAEAADER